MLVEGRKKLKGRFFVLAWAGAPLVCVGQPRGMLAWHIAAFVKSGSGYFPWIADPGLMLKADGSRPCYSHSGELLG